MKIEPEDLDKMARREYKMLQTLRVIGESEATANRPSAALLAEIESAKDLAVLNLRLLLRLGAADPEENRPTRETPLHLLGSEAAQTFAHAMREAASWAVIVDDERGIEDGRGELLEDYAFVAEMECFGPVGLARE